MSIKAGEHLAEPDILAAEIAEDLQAALARLSAIGAELEGEE